MNAYELKQQVSEWVRQLLSPLVNAYGFGSLFVIGAVIGVVILIWWYKFSGFHTPKYNRRLGYEPKPRTTKQSWLPSSMAQWKSGIYGPNQDLGHKVAYMGHHLLSVNKDQATLRLDFFHFRRLALFMLCAGFLFTLTTLMILDDYRKFYKRGGGECPYKVETENGWQHRLSPVKRDFFSYFKSKYCFFKYAFYQDQIQLDTIEKKKRYLLSTNFIKFYVWIISTLLLIYSTLLPVPAPLVADRKNRLFYTHHKGKLYLADWNSLAFSIVGGMFYRHTLAVQLFTQTPSGDWESRWFTLAEHNYGIREWRNFYLGTLEVAFHRYWGQRCWLLRYMDLGPDAIHGVMPHKGFLDTLNFRHQTLPDDITQQARDAVAHNGGKAPVDDDFVNTKPAKEVKHLLKLGDRLDLTALPK